MILFYLKALLKRADTQALTQFNPPVLPQNQFVEHLKPDAGHYAAYCQNVGWTNIEQPHPCYLQARATAIQMQCLSAKSSPFPLLGLIHRTNEITQHNNVDLTQPIKLMAQFYNIHAHPKGWEVAVKVTAEQQGHEVYQAIGRYLVRIDAPHVERKVETTPTPNAHWDEFAEVSVIDAPESIGRRYAKLSGDYNPIHLSQISAKSFGFDQAIAHGMWSLARCVTELEKRAQSEDGGVAPISQIYCEFKRPVLLPAVTHLMADEPEQETTTFALLDHGKTAPHILGTVSYT